MAGAGLSAAKKTVAGTSPIATATRRRKVAAPEAPIALEVSGLKASYGEKTVLTGLDFNVRVGELVTLLGANGSGKSTALRCLVGLRRIDGGQVLLENKEFRATDSHDQRNVSMVFQQPHLVKRMSVIDNVCTGALGRLSLWQSSSRMLLPSSLREEAMHCLDRVGLADRAADKAGKLSGGQQQRVAIARALCQGAPLLLADEPVSALDPASAEQVLGLLADLAHTDQLAVLAVLHQPELARRYSDRLIGLKDGSIVFDLKPAKVTAAAVTALYDGSVPTMEMS